MDHPPVHPTIHPPLHPSIQRSIHPPVQPLQPTNGPRMQVEAQNHRFSYNEPIRVEALTQGICDLALNFAEVSLRPYFYRKKALSYALKAF